MALTDSLISYWKLDEASGSAEDAHSTNDLTQTEATIGSATGKINNARDFELASTHAFKITDNASLSVGDIDFTITAWVRFESKVADEMTISTKSNGTDGDWFLNYTDDTDRIKFQVYTAGGFGASATVEANNLGSPSTATWYFIVAWHDASANTINIQVNNGTVDTTSHSGGVLDAANTEFYLGGDAFANYWDGLIDEVGFWKRVLTSDERSQLYNSGNGLSYDSFSGSDVTLAASGSAFTAAQTTPAVSTTVAL